MKSIVLVLALVLSGSLRARAQEPVPLAHGNVPGEPHHHLRLENEYVRVYYVEAPPHESTLLHQHDHDYIYVSLGPSDVVNAILNKPEIHLQLKDGETHFTRGGFAHVARNLADTPFRNITIELLHPQGEAHNRCERVAQGDKGSCIIDREMNSYKITRLFETDEIELFLVKLAPGGKLQEFPDRDHLLVALDQATLAVRTQGKAEENLIGGDSAWLSRLTSQTVQNPANSASSFLSVSFKDSSPKRVY